MTSRSQETGGRVERLHALDLTRGVCAMSVIVYHFLLWTEIARVESMGTFSVYMFFILSALTMAHNYIYTFKSEIALSTLRKFFVNRIARIMPLLFIVASAMQLLRMASDGTFSTQDLSRFLLTASGLFSLHSAGLSSNTIGAWSLAVEILFYALFPVLMLLFANMRRRTLFLIAACLIPAQHAGIALAREYSDPIDWYIYASPIVFAPYFMIGFLIQRDSPRGSSLSFWGGLLFLFVVLGFSFAVNARIMSGGLIHLFLTIMSGVTIWFMYHARVPAWLRRGAVFLGEISYAVYLVHWFVFQALGLLRSHLGLPISIAFPVFLVTCCIVAYVTYLWVEMPLQRVVRKALNGKETNT